MVICEFKIDYGSKVIVKKWRQNCVPIESAFIKIRIPWLYQTQQY